MRFPGFTDEWKQYAIDELAEIYGRIGFRGYTTADLVEKGNGAISLSPSNIIDNHLYTDKDNTYISYYKYEESPEIKIYEGDVIFVKTGSTVGKVAFVDKLDSEATLNPQLVVFKQIKCDNYLFSQIMATTKIQKIISKITVGGAVPTLSQSELGKVRISLPDKNEQQIISSLLASIDERIATQNKIIEDLKKLKSAISAKLFDGHHVSDISNGWKVVRLGDITEKFSHRNKNSDSYPMFSVTNTSGFSPQYEVFEGKEIKDEDISIYKIIHKGDFAYNPARINVGSIGRYDEEEPCMISSLYVCFRPTAQVDSDWLLYYLQSAKKIYQYGIFGEGGVRIYLFYPNFSRIEALLPPLTVQKEIASILKSFNRKIKLEELLLSNYQKQKKFLLAQMFT